LQVVIRRATHIAGEENYCWLLDALENTADSLGNSKELIFKFFYFLIYENIAGFHRLQ